MRFQCHFTDGPAQSGLLTLNSQKIKTPTLLFPNTNSYQLPSYAKGFISQLEARTYSDRLPRIYVGNSIFFPPDKESEQNSVQNYLIIPEALPSSVQQYLHQFDKQQHKDIIVLPSDEELTKQYINPSSSHILIISHAAQLFTNPKKFVSYLLHVRQSCNYDSLIFLPAIATPETLALLCYLGCDLFDTTSAIVASHHQHFYLPDTTSTHVNNITENPCVCPICSQAQDLPNSFSSAQLLQHNYHMLWKELLTIRHSIQHNHLRDLVEKRVRNTPHLVTLLRYLDVLGQEYLEQRTPVFLPEPYILQTTSREAGFRPEIKRFQHRILTRYKTPESKKILLLLPCSAKKPYSFSKSHQRFSQVISQIANPDIIHEVIVTSPLGLVPRELELTYPASCYDISVTGIWYEDEKHMIQQQLNQFLQQNQYDAIVSHLPTSLVHPPKGLKKIWHQSGIGEKTTSKESLQSLRKILTNLTSTNKHERISKSEQKMVQIKAIARYQFGSTLANALTEKIIVKGKYPYLKILDINSEQLGMIPDRRGLISLTEEGGNRMSHLGRYTVSIDTGFTVKGSILSPGVHSADRLIRKGDDVIVFQGKDYLGVGCAKMNGTEMSQRMYGEAVNMRHKVKT